MMMVRGGGDPWDTGGLRWRHRSVTNDRRSHAGRHGGRPTRWFGCCGGESLDELSRELRVEAHRLQAWRDEFLAHRGVEGKAVAAGGPQAQRGRTQDRRADARERGAAGGDPEKGLDPAAEAAEIAVELDLARKRVCGILGAARRSTPARQPRSGTRVVW